MVHRLNGDRRMFQIRCCWRFSSAPTTCSISSRCTSLGSQAFYLRWNQLEHDESRESCLRWKRLVVAVVFERRPTTSSRDISPRCGWKAQVIAGRSKNSFFNDRNSPGLLEQWGGLHYLPLTAQPFLRVQTLVTRTQVLRKKSWNKKVLHKFLILEIMYIQQFEIRQKRNSTFLQ